MRKEYPTGISKEVFEEIKPLLYLLKSGCQWCMPTSAIGQAALGRFLPTSKIFEMSELGI